MWPCAASPADEAVEKKVKHSWRIEVNQKWLKKGVISEQQEPLNMFCQTEVIFWEIERQIKRFGTSSLQIRIAVTHSLIPPGHFLTYTGGTELEFIFLHKV